jgi:hypothetical protein
MAVSQLVEHGLGKRAGWNERESNSGNSLGAPLFLVGVVTILPLAFQVPSTHSEFWKSSRGRIGA